MGKKKVINMADLYRPSENPQQWIAHQLSERYILYGGAKGGGKTAWGVNEAIRLSIQFPGNRGFMGCREGTDFKKNALDQFLHFMPPELYAPPLGIHHKTESYFKLINGSLIYYGGIGSDEEAEQKINNMPQLGWFFIDQAEQITERQFLMLDAQLRYQLPGIKYKALLTANPDPGWLRDRFIGHDYPDHRFIPALPKDNPFLPSDYEEKLRELWPAEMVKRLLEGDWDIPGKDFIIPYQNIRMAIDRDMPASGVKVAGVDVSRYGNDESVFMLRQGHKVIHIATWSHQDTTFSAGKVAELIREFKPVVTNIDSIGVGAGVFDPLRSEGYNVREINVGEKSSKPDVYLNLRAEYYSKLSKKFENGEIDIPDNAALSSQLAGIKYKYKGTKLQIESKEDMRKRGLKSPDLADALMLAFIESTVKREASVYIRGRRIA